MREVTDDSCHRLVDELPNVPGVRECWGRGVLHCPYCHGWEVRDQAIGVLASGPISVHQALLFRHLSHDVTYFTHTMPPLTDEKAEQLAARGIRVVEGEVASVETAGDHLTGVRLKDGTLVQREALVVAPRMVARTAFLADLGLKPQEHPSGAGEHILCDATGRTDVPGVWAAGNVTDLMAQVGSAAAAGTASCVTARVTLLPWRRSARRRIRCATRRMPVANRGFAWHGRCQPRATWS